MFSLFLVFAVLTSVTMSYSFVDSDSTFILEPQMAQLVYAQQLQEPTKAGSIIEDKTNDISQLDPSRPLYVPRDLVNLTGPTFGYPLYDENGTVTFWLDYDSVDNFERQMFDWSKPGFPPTTMPSDKLPEKIQSKLELTKPFLDWNNKIDPHLQRDVHFVKMFLGQSMTVEEIGNLYYKVYIKTNGSYLLPDYAKSLRNNDAISETFDNFPSNDNTEFLKHIGNTTDLIIIPIIKLNEFARDDGIKSINAGNYNTQLSLTPNGPSSDEFQFKHGLFTSPNQQLQNNVPSVHVKCNDMVLMLKLSDLSPICVKQSTSQKLLDRNIALEV